MYCESQEKAQSQTHLSALLFKVFRRLKSAVDQILQVPSADVVANRLIIFKCLYYNTINIIHLTSSQD